MGDSPNRQTSFADYLDLLRAFDQRGAEALIVGGQAVNFWAEAFENEEPEVRGLRPFTSADLDLLRPDPSAGRILHSQAKDREREEGSIWQSVHHRKSYVFDRKQGWPGIDHRRFESGSGTYPWRGPKRNDRGRISRRDASDFESHSLSQSEAA
jgi:hypothetical protein